MKRKRTQHYQGYYSTYQQSRLENLYLRFPVLGKQILNKLDNQSLGTFKHVSRPINDFIVNEKVVWIRKILKHVGNDNELPEMWKKVLHHAPKDKVRKLSEEVSAFYTYDTDSDTDADGDTDSDTDGDTDTHDQTDSDTDDHTRD